MLGLTIENRRALVNATTTRTSGIAFAEWNPGDLR